MNMELRVLFTDPLVGCSRQSVEEDLEGWLGTSGEIVGGGAATNGAWANIDLTVDDKHVTALGLPAFVDRMRAVLRASQVPPSTKITAFVSDDRMDEFVVG